MSKTIIVTGDRNWTNHQVILTALSRLDGDVLLHGAARGADSLAANIGKALGMKVIAFPAEWNKYGKAAGPVRNNKMLDYPPDFLCGFNDDIIKSRGTKHCIKAAIKRGISGVLYDSNGNSIPLEDIVFDQRPSVE